VHGVHRVAARDLKDVPATVAKAASSYSRAVLPWNGHSVGLLDEERLFHTLQRSLA
jgi:chemotaxis-related protein WspD